MTVILVVDDHRDVGEVLCRVLDRLGYPCQLSCGGPDALAAIRAHPPEQPLLVVMDEMMPNMSGIEVLRAIRADPKIMGTTVIFYSAGFDIAKRDEALTLGAVAWLLKGGDYEKTLQAITNWYERVGGVAREKRPEKKRDPI
jgi:two-component system phosphate regulon response regulator PhoB